MCYDLAMAIKEWLQKPENIGYRGLSMCEVALIDDRFKSARPFVKEAEVQEAGNYIFCPSSEKFYTVFLMGVRNNFDTP